MMELLKTLKDYWFLVAAAGVAIMALLRLILWWCIKDLATKTETKELNAKITQHGEDISGMKSTLELIKNAANIFGKTDNTEKITAAITSAIEVLVKNAMEELKRQQNDHE